MATQVDPLASIGGIPASPPPVSSASLQGADPLASIGGVPVNPPAAAQAPQLGDDLSDTGLQASYPQTDSGPATFGQDHPAITNIGRGMGDSVTDIFNSIKGIPSGIWHSLPPVQLADTMKRTLPVINTYEQSRASGKSIGDSIQAADLQVRKQDNVSNTIKQVTDAFKANPTRETARAVSDAAALAVSIFAGGGAGAEGAEAGWAGEAAEGSEVAGTEAATDATAATAPAIVTPKATAVAKGVSRAADAGVSEGTAETIAPTGEDIQPLLHTGIRNFVNSTLDDAGLDTVPDSVPVTDAPQQLADSFQARSQDVFNQIEEITGVNPTTLKEQMAARADQITEATASGDMEKAGKLDMLQKADENRGIQAFNSAKAQNPDLDIQQARSDWTSSIRGDELSAAVRGSKANTSTLKNPVIDPGKLAPRLQKLSESQPGGKASKLFQLGGEDNATALVEHAENARDATAAIKDFVPQSPTGQKLFSQILSNNTVEKTSLLVGGKVVGKTDWGGVVKDLGDLSPVQQSALGNDLAKMRQVASKQVVKQNAMDLLIGKTTLGKTARVAAGEELIRRTR